MNSVIEGIKKDGLCLGCGLCQSVCGKDAVEMKLESDGFFKPEVKEIIPEKELIIDRICPGKNVINDVPFNKDEKIWGKIQKLYSGYSTDAETRQVGSSGGIVSGLAIYMLQNKVVDAVLQVGGDSSDYERNTFKISKTREDVLKCASSRYAPALIFDNFFDILNNSNDTFCFIGKPCDISGLKNFLNEYPQFKDRFKLTISIMCAGMPSFNGTKAIIDEFTSLLPVKDLVYRGNGWPGYFSFKDKKGTRFQKTYNDSWGKTLNQHLNFRCKICPDGVGLQADIAVGDAWETKDGYPDFTEKEGQSLIIARTTIAKNMLSNAIEDKDIICEDLAVEKIQLMQPYQFARRRRVGARVMALNVFKRKKVVNFTNLSIFKNILEDSPQIILKEFLGTLKRLIK